MNQSPSLSQRDNATIWHPYTPMKIRPNALGIVRGEGALLYDESGKSYIDAVSSWWVNLHGHAHPDIAQAIYTQATTLAHCMFASLTHEPAVALAERLLAITPAHLSRVFYSDNGSCATEIAIKMALQAFHNRGEARSIIVAFEEGYHGDTFGAMSASSRGLFTTPFNDKLFEVVFIPPPKSANAPQSEQALAQILATGRVAALIVEPLVQGAAGMQHHDATGLSRLFTMTQTAGAYVIADEVMTGFGRTGSLFACDQLSVAPDMMCLSKGLTGGTLPLAVTLCSESIYQAFYSDDMHHALYHGHSYTANPLACAASLASLELLLTQDCDAQRAFISEQHAAFALKIQNHPRVADLRHIGTILAFDIHTRQEAAPTAYLSQTRDRIYHYFIERGILLRPIGNVLYLIPPYCITEAQLAHIYRTIIAFLDHEFTADLAIV